jgi:hypothetical protein
MDHTRLDVEPVYSYLAGTPLTNVPEGKALGGGRVIPTPSIIVVIPAGYFVPSATAQMCIAVAPPLVVLLTFGNVIDSTVLLGSTGTVVA